MAATQSTMLELGTTAPHFALDDTEGKFTCIDDFWADRALLVVFVSDRCPYVKHIAPALGELAREYRPRGVAFVAINPNPDEGRPGDDTEPLRLPFPYLRDQAQSIARAYNAACTPDLYLFDEERQLVYRGEFDDSRPGNGVPVTGRALRAALDAVLEGREVPAEQTPSVGCGIRWV
ncbi:MAG TPA: thioredoxin family protein [Longimicrobiaceae bacterium]|nr:thioredoxin family protein [Longimicrobiaceae bacterium]